MLLYCRIVRDSSKLANVNFVGCNVGNLIQSSPVFRLFKNRKTKKTVNIWRCAEICASFAPCRKIYTHSYHPISTLHSTSQPDELCHSGRWNIVPAFNKTLLQYVRSLRIAPLTLYFFIDKYYESFWSICLNLVKPDSFTI